MKRSTFSVRFFSAIGHAALGGLCGSLLAAWGASLSDSPVAAIGLIVLGAVAGALCAGARGIVFGVVAAALAGSVGLLIRESALSISVTITACALLFAWIGWVSSVRKRAQVPNVHRAPTLMLAAMARTILQTPIKQNNDAPTVKTVA